MRNYIIYYRGSSRTIWLSQAYLIAQLGVSDDYLKLCRTRASKDTNASWQWKKIEGGFYYNYDTIPDREPKRYKSLLPTALEFVEDNMKPRAAVDSGYAKNKMLSGLSKHWSQEDVRWFMFESPVAFSQEKALQLAMALGMSRMLAEVVYTASYIEFGLSAVKDFYEVAITVLKELSLYGMKVSTSMSLRHRIADFIEVKYKTSAEDRLEQERLAMVPGKYGNVNANIVGKEVIVDTETGECATFDVHKTIMMYLYMNIGKPNKTHKVACYEEYLQLMGDLKIRKVIAYRTFCAHTNQLYNKVWAAVERHGQAYFNQEYNTYVAAARLQYSNSLWVADGSGVKLKYNDGSKYGNSLYLMRIHDVASTACIGYHISTGKGEDAAHVNAALKMAFETSGGYAALDLLSDNHGAFTEKKQSQRLSLLFPKVRTITAGNSQENPAEVFVKLVNKVGRRFQNWLHSSYAAKSVESVANPDRMDVNKYPSYEGAVEQVIQMIHDYNNKSGADGLTPLQRFDQNRSPQSTLISDQTRRYAFGNKTKVELANMRGYVNVSKNGQKYRYTIPNYEQSLEVISRASGWVGGAEVYVYFDEKGCDIYTLDEVYILTCTPTVLAHKSYAEATEESTDALGRLKDRKRKMVAKADKFVQDVQRGMEILSGGGGTELPEQEPMHYEHIAALTKDSKVKEVANEWQEKMTDAQHQELKRQRIRQRALDQL